MQSKMKCPSELRGLRPRTEEGVKFCYSYNLGKECAANCSYAHRCMRCGYSRCWAQNCFLLKQSDYNETSYEPSSKTTSWNHSRYQPYSTAASDPSSSSKDNKISLLTKNVDDLQRHVEKRDLVIRDLAKTVRRMEQTLKRHNLDLDKMEEISSSDLDWSTKFRWKFFIPYCFKCDYTSFLCNCNADWHLSERLMLTILSNSGYSYRSLAPQPIDYAYWQRS